MKRPTQKARGLGRRGKRLGPKRPEARAKKTRGMGVDLEESVEEGQPEVQLPQVSSLVWD